MVKKQYTSTASDHTKHIPYLSNLHSLSKNHRGRTLTFLDAHRTTSAKVVAHAATESSGSPTQRKNPFEVGRNSGDEFLRVYPFVEEPVRFNFGDDYGYRLFLDLQKEISCGRHNYGLGRLTLGAVKKAENCSSNDVYALSSEADMVSSFLRDGLFR